jgi:predicted ester cyclase
MSVTAEERSLLPTAGSLPPQLEEADMASDEPTRLIARIFDEVVNEGRVESIDELFAADFLDHGPGADLHGPEAFRAAVTSWRAAFPDVHCEVSNIVSDGDTAGWVVHTTGTHTGDGLGFPATNRRIDTLSANVGRFRDGKAVEHWSDQGMLVTLQQLGVIPVMTPAEAVS